MVVVSKYKKHGGFGLVVLRYLWDMLLGIITNSAILVPSFAWLAAQVIKTTVNSVVLKKFAWKRMFGDGGMPSAHSATVTSLAIVVGDACGYGSSIFGLATMFAIVVMHDALGVRRETGKQAESILTMAEVIKDYVDEPDMDLKTEKLKVLVGHTPLQVVCGSLLGLVIALGYIIIFRGFIGLW